MDFDQCLRPPIYPVGLGRNRLTLVLTTLGPVLETGTRPPGFQPPAILAAATPRDCGQNLTGATWGAFLPADCIGLDPVAPSRASRLSCHVIPRFPCTSSPTAPDIVPLPFCGCICAPLARLGPTVPSTSLLPVRDQFFNSHSGLDLGTLLGCDSNCASPVWLSPMVTPTSLLPVRDQFCKLYLDVDLGTAAPILAELYAESPGWVAMATTQRQRL
eukprot:282649-Rhodomonas_salina.1